MVSVLLYSKNQWGFQRCNEDSNNRSLCRCTTRFLLGKLRQQTCDKQMTWKHKKIGSGMLSDKPAGRYASLQPQDLCDSYLSTVSTVSN